MAMDIRKLFSDAFSGVFLLRLLAGACVAGLTAWYVSFAVSDYVVKANTSSTNEAFASLRTAIEANTDRSNQNAAALQQSFANLVETINNNTQQSSAATDRLVRSLEQTDDSLRGAITDNTSAIRGLTEAADAQRVRVEELGRQVNRMEQSIEQATFRPGLVPELESGIAPYVWTNYGSRGPVISGMGKDAATRVKEALSVGDSILSYDFGELFVQEEDGSFTPLSEKFNE